MIERNIIALTVFSVLFCGCANNINQNIINPETYKMSNTNNLNKSEIIDKFLSEKSFNGSIAIIKNHKLFYKKSFGFADYRTQKKIKEDTPFNLASCSKPITAMAIMILKEKNLISYDDPITKYIPQLKQYSNITVRHLLNQTSGIPDYLSAEIIENYWNKEFSNWTGGEFVVNKDLINLFEKYQIKSNSSPQIKFQYSNSNYAFLASITEKASGMSFGEFIKRNIFVPLKMDKSFSFGQGNLDNIAYSFDLGNGNPVFNELTGWDGVLGDGNVFSSINDLIKLEQALYTEKIISQESLMEAFRKPVLKNGQSSEYGFGWLILNSSAVMHHGSWNGYKSSISRNYANGNAIIILNNTGEDLSALENEIAGIAWN